ncbi:MAG: hypothetical protein AB7R90_19370 [Reyranellaceae bacterium]
MRIPRLRDLLHRFAGTRPLRVIDGQTERNPEETAPLFERYFLCEIPRWLPLIGARWGGGAVYLHHYLRSDPDRGVHDHPWDHALAVQLCGGYVEERLDGVSHLGRRLRYVSRRPGRGYALRGSDFHRVLVPEGAATSWSLFAHGPYRKGWGFLSDAWRADPRALQLPPAAGVDDSEVFLVFHPFRNVNDGNSKWWRDRVKHPPGRQQPRADADGRIPSPQRGEGKGEGERAAARVGRLAEDLQ